MDGFSVETTPASAVKVPSFRDYLQEGTVVYVTFLPGSDFADTISVSRRLIEEKMCPVPHFAARSIKSRAVFEESLKILSQEAGIKHVLLIGGAVSNPLGEYSDTMQLLDTGLLDKYGIEKIGLAGHPEGSPDMSDESITAALRWKNAFQSRTDASLYLITQFTFDAEPIIAWDQALQADGITLPIRVGLPGLASIRSLLKHAQACGVGASISVLKKQAGNIHKLLYRKAPDQQLIALARYRAQNPNTGLSGIHMYPLGGLKPTVIWSYAVTAGQFTLAKNGHSLALDESAQANLN